MMQENSSKSAGAPLGVGGPGRQPWVWSGYYAALTNSRTNTTARS